MSKQDVARREFLAGAALGAGVVAGGRYCPKRPPRRMRSAPRLTLRPLSLYARVRTAMGMAPSSMKPMPRRLRRSPNG
jgi:hypothetical protein